MRCVIRTKEKKVKAEIFDCPEIRKMIQGNGKSKNRIVGEMFISCLAKTNIYQKPSRCK